MSTTTDDAIRKNRRSSRYKDAWNRAWETTADALEARNRAWVEVRARFEKDPLSGRWLQKHRVDANVTTDFVKIRGGD